MTRNHDALTRVWAAELGPRVENGVFMKIVLIGANGTIGELVQKALAGAGHEIVKAGR